MRQMVKCPDRKGVIAALAQLLYGLGCNILASDQFTAEVRPFACCCLCKCMWEAEVPSRRGEGSTHDSTFCCRRACTSSGSALTCQELWLALPMPQFWSAPLRRWPLRLSQPNTAAIIAQGRSEEQFAACDQQKQFYAFLMSTQVADRFGMEWKLFYDKSMKRVALLVSRMDHCLYDILIRHRAGDDASSCWLPLPCTCGRGNKRGSVICQAS